MNIENRFSLCQCLINLYNEKKVQLIGHKRFMFCECDLLINRTIETDWKFHSMCQD